jgi:uncharacterized surface protein with fasciclin (FAS1) repeats
MKSIRSLFALSLSTLVLATALAPVASADAPGRELDIVMTAQKAGSFKTLLRLVRQAGLQDELKSAGPFTVFAPTDEAFAKLPAGTLQSLAKDRAALRNILLYHVVSGEVTAAQVVGLPSATTLQGGSISIAVQGGTVVLNGTTNVIATDVFASNGVIHVIDSVLLPQ